MPHQVSPIYTLGPGGSIQPSLRFAARSVRIDNLGGQWPQADTSGITPVPPFNYGAIINIPAQNSPTVIDAPLPGFVSNGTGQPAQIQFYEDVLPPSPGAFFSATSQPSSGTFNITGSGSGASSYAFDSAETLPAGTFTLDTLNLSAGFTPTAMHTPLTVTVGGATVWTPPDWSGYIGYAPGVSFTVASASKIHVVVSGGGGGGSFTLTALVIKGAYH